MAPAKSSFGYGQADPTNSTTQFNRIAFLIRQMVAQMDTMKLVQVMKVNSNGEVAAAGTVDVLPLVNQIDGNANGSPHGVIYGIPWFRLQGAQNGVICDPVAGDIGYVIAADRDISSVKATKKQANPPSRRRFSISDGVYVGGVLGQELTQYLAFLDTGIKIVDKFGNVLETTETGITLTPKSGAPVTIAGPLVVQGDFRLGGAFKAQNGSSPYGGAIETIGEVTAKVGASSVSLSTHTHSQPNDSHNDVEQETDAPTGGT